MVPGPDHFAALRLKIEDKLGCPVDDWPVSLYKAAVLSYKPVMPNAGRDVGDTISVEFGVFDAIAEVVVVPASVSTLQVKKPLIAEFSFGDEPAGSERHDRLDMVPRVSVTPGNPLDHPVRQLPFSDRRRCLRNVGLGEHPGDARNLHS